MNQKKWIMTTNNNKISIDYDDNDDDFIGFIQLIETHTERQKNSFLSEIDRFGDVFIDELERKKKRELELKKEIIPIILKKEPNKYDYNVLLSYSYNDVRDIYNDVKAKRGNIFVRLFKFIFFT